MGMDVIGRNAVNATGEYFRASVWSWRPLHELIRGLCGDLLDEEVMTRMQWNDGAGPDDPSVCKKMAERFKAWLATFDDEEYYLESEPTGETPEGAVAEMMQHLGIEIVGERNYSIDREMLESWTEFLNCCGGFQVY